MINCDKCSGSGRLPRERRRLDDGKFDPLDFRTEELCGKCGGSGKTADKPVEIVERQPGFVADQIAAIGFWRA